MTGLIDYGAGNLFSVQNAFTEVGEDTILLRSPEDFGKADRFVLPGVGHFGQMMWALTRLGLDVAVQNAALRGAPLLGICLGMQAFFESSEEAVGTKGLGILKGVVRALPDSVRVPHMGWNQVEFSEDDKGWFTFANSFVVYESADAWGTTSYGVDFVSAVRSNTVWGFQFHPEKSGPAGLNILKEWCQGAG